MICKNCGMVIRWTELHGWVHGRNGDGYEEKCSGGETVAELRDEDKWWRD